MAAAKKSTTEIRINAPNYKILNVGIVGTAPYVSNNFSQEAQEMMQDAQAAGATAKTGGKKRDPRLPDTPLLSELMDQYKVSDLNRRLVSVMLVSGEFGSAPMFAAPGTPAEQVRILRAAYAKALTSPELVADAKKQGLEPELIPGDEMEALAKEVLNQPSEVITLMKKVMGE